ncbi:anthranilate phosphoribosyltransferase [Planktosalinus lacus]|uniref:Anthranilate phosphoribosyltransferase n=1 Tax=Planktosalinus lacus TaxID=1526573 RepID=A0A8J2YBL9_9FLAO|nr:anthranilate phosphoribosyltransferase [Planktosalinus lacus]GGD96927.1 anthranilate phosphoribosyltransferase [Planktosalinus lacus]
MKEILEYLYQHKTLSKKEARQILMDIALEKYNHNEIASFLTAFIMRNITIEELRGFREALLELAIKVDLSDFNPMDVCGTGGDGKNTFNVSTLTSLVVAGAGIPVAKHGNYGVSSISGSSNVLEAMGVVFHTDESKLKQQLDQANICFMHAPLFHTAMRFVAPVRRELGVKTFFNMLGPLVNPAQPKIQMTGVFSMELARMYHYLFQEDDMQYAIVFGLDGYDEITLTSDTKILTNEEEYITNAAAFGFEKTTQSEIYGGETIEDSATIFNNILDGKGTRAQNQVVLANAAVAMKSYHNKYNTETAIQLAEASLLGGKAKQTLTKLIALQ